MKTEQAVKMLLEAKGDEQKLTLATIEIALANYPESKQELIRNAVFAASVPHWFDSEILHALLGNISKSEANSLFKILRGFSFVEAFPARNACNIHERTRLSLLRWMGRNQSQKYKELSARAADYFYKIEKIQEHIEWAYHLIISKPDEASGFIATLHSVWSKAGRVEPQQALATILDEHIKENRVNGHALATALVTIAMLEMYNRPLANMKSRLNMALRIARKTSDKSLEGMTLKLRGDVEHALGHLGVALRLYKSAFAIARKTAASSKMNKSIQNHIWSLLLSIGTIQLERRRYTDALNSYRASLIIAKKLVKNRPNDSRYQSILLESYSAIGRLLEKKKRISEALRSYRLSLAIAKKLAKRDPENVTSQVDLGASLDNIGDIQMRRGINNLSVALQSFQSALVIAKKLAASYPKEKLYQKNLDVAYTKIGHVFLLKKRPIEALESFKKALLITEQLVKHDPQNVEWKSDMKENRDTVTKVEGIIANLGKPSA